MVGVGRLGDSLLSYNGFESFGVNILAGFDTDPSKIRLDTVKPVYLMSELNEFCRSRKIRIGIITVPADRAQKAANHLAEAGVDAIWNFAPAKLTVPDSILLRNENLNVSLAVLRTRLDPK